jgi:hypothetical protein
LDAYAKESEAKPAQLDRFENGAGLNVAGRAAPSDCLMFASMGCGDSYCGALNRIAGHCWPFWQRRGRHQGVHLHADEVESEDKLTPAEIEWIGQLQRIVDQEELEALQQSA